MKSTFPKLSWVSVVVGIWAIISHSIIHILFLPRSVVNLGPLITTFLIGYFLEYSLQWNKTLFQKIISGILIILVICSPIIGLIIGLCIFPSTEPVSLIDRAREGATKESLDVLRTSINDYYEENNIYPVTLDTQVHIIETSTLPPFIPNYLESIPKVQLRREISRIDSTEVLIVSTKPDQKIQPEQITDKGGWIYSSSSGDIRINCTHKDLKNISYYEW